MGFEDIFNTIGQIGTYQVCLFLMLGLPSMFTGYQNMAMIFLGGDQDHFCTVPRLANFSYPQQKYIGIPEDAAKGRYSQCYYYDLPYNNLTDDELIAWNRSSVDGQVEIIRCNQGWTYDQSEFIFTVVSKWDLVCEDSFLNQLISTIYLMGMLVGAASSGVLSDRFGRKTTFMIFSVCHLIIAMTAAYVDVYWVFTLLRLGVAAFGHGAYLCAFVIIMELIGPKYRTWAAIFYQIFFALGFMILPGIAYWVRDSVTLQVVLAAPVSLLMAFIFLAPESPRWLLSRGLYAKAEAVISKICAVNEKPMPPDLIETLTEKMDDLPKGKYTDLFRYPNMRREIIIVYFNWFTNNLLYYGFSLNTSTLAGSLYVNTLLSALVEVPAKLLALLMLEKVGRRACVVISELTAAAASGICVILILIDNDDISWMLTFFTMIGKMGITASFSGIYVYTAELFPTPIRHLAVGSSSMMARLSGLLAPFMGEPMMNIWSPLPSLVFGLFALLAGSTALLLPETKGLKMPDTIEEAENIGKKKNNTNNSVDPQDKKQDDLEKDVAGNENNAYVEEADHKAENGWSPDAKEKANGTIDASVETHTKGISNGGSLSNPQMKAHTETTQL